MSDYLPLLSTLEGVFSDTGDLLVTFVVDSSGSIGNEYEILRSTILTLVEALSGITLQIVQFSQYTIVECGFTRNMKLLRNTILGMKHMKGSTNMHDAFKVTRETYQRCVTNSSKPVIFFLTDGRYTGKNPHNEINNLLAMKPSPKIIGVGVGSGTTEGDLQRLFPAQAVYHVNNFAGLNQAVKELKIEKKREAPLRISFSPSNTKLQKSRADLKLKITCEPLPPLTSIPAHTIIRFQGSQFFLPEEIKLSTAATRENPFRTEVVLRVTDFGKRKGTFPENIWYEAEIPGEGKYKGCITMVLGWLAGDFVLERYPDTNINILIWGPMGSGKSSFINGFCTVLSLEEEIIRQVAVLKSKGHVTKDYSYFDIAKLIAIQNQDKDHEFYTKQLEDNLKLRMWDPWGLTEMNYQKLNIVHFLEGRVSNHTSMTDNVSMLAPRVDENLIHAVIILIPIGTSEQTAVLDRLSEQIVQCVSSKIKPVVVVNWRDDLTTEEEINNAYNTIVKHTGLSKDEVFMIDNYVDESSRNMSKDLVYWKIMKKVFSVAKIKVSEYSGIQKPSKKGNVCGKIGCANFQKEVDGKFCGSCGSSIVSLKSSKGRVCTNPECESKGKPVLLKFCPMCGKEPIVQEKVCSTSSCENFGKTVRGRFCEFCGVKVEISNNNNSISGSKDVTPKKEIEQRVCLTSGCTNYNVNISKNVRFCPFCGDTPKKKPNKVKFCQNKQCEKFGYKSFGGSCSTCSMISVTGDCLPIAKRCGNLNCEKYNAVLDDRYKVCGNCGKQPLLSKFPLNL